METIEEMIPGLDKIDRYIACFLPDEKKDTKEWISYILTGETILNPAEFVKKIGELLTSYGQEWKKLFFSILLLFLVSAMLSSFMEAFKSAGSAKAAKLLFLLCELVIVIRVWKSIEEIAQSSMTQMLEFMKIAVPGFMSCLAVTGSITTAMIFQKLILGTIAVIEAMVVSSVFPLLKVYIAFATVETVTGEGRFLGMMELIKKSVHYITNGCIVLLSASQTLQLLITPIIDKTNVNLVRKTAAAIPGIGDLTESVSSITLASMIAIKNSFGVVILLVLVIMVIAPIIKIFGLLWTLKLSSAVGMIGGDKDMSHCISYITEAGFLTLRMIIMMTALFLMTIALLTNATGGVG